MLWLDVVSGPSKGSRIPVEGDDLTLGRGEAAPWSLGGDKELSRRHASIRRAAAGRLEIEDLGSRHGTLVNGSAISGPTALEPGDEVSVGASTLKVGAPEPEPIRRAALRVVAGWAPGALIPLEEEEVTVGRAAAGAEAFGDDAGVAERHAKVSTLGDGRVLVEDLGSEGGTRVGGRGIHAPTILKPGDRLEIGRATLELIQVAGEIRAEPVRAVGGVSRVPEGMFALIAARAPVTREEVTRVFFLSLGWAFAVNLAVRTLAIETLDVPKNLTALKFPGFGFAIFFPVILNTYGFYKAFRRPKDTSVLQYLGPTFVITIGFIVLNLAITNHSGALEVAIIVALTVLPTAICAGLMFRLRAQVARDRVGAVRGTG